MKKIYVNLKRFDVPREMGGVNDLADIRAWASHLVAACGAGLSGYQGEAEFTFFFPEAHLLGATAAVAESKHPIRIGCQGVYREDVQPGGNFGAFTTHRPAAAAMALGCSMALVGHCEERKGLAGVLAAADVANPAAVSRILNQEMRFATARGLHILYCVGETEAERPRWQEVLQEQLSLGLEGIERERITIAYEPVWAIGPGKTPPDRETIRQIAQFIKAETGGLPVVYGGGLKADNAAMLASIAQLDGGLIALTRFSGDIGFYPEEYLEIVRLYLGHATH